MDHDVLARQLVRSIRGKTTQRSLSQKLKFSHNQVYRWESGTREIKWVDFVSLAEACHKDVAAALNLLGYAGPPDATADLCRHLLFGQPSLQVSSRAGVSRFALSRWLNGKGAPGLADILSLISLTPLITEFVGKMVDPSMIPEIQALHRRHSLERALTYQYPQSTAVLQCLSLRAYRALKAHKEGWIAQRIGIPIEEEKVILRMLSELELIRYDRIWIPDQETRLDTRGDLQGAIKIRQYWLQRELAMLEGLQSRPENSSMGQLVFSVSVETAKAIKQEYRGFFERVRGLIDQDRSEPESVWLLNIQLLDLKESGSGN